MWVAGSCPPGPDPELLLKLLPAASSSYAELTRLLQNHHLIGHYCSGCTYKKYYGITPASRVIFTLKYISCLVARFSAGTLVSGATVACVVLGQNVNVVCDCGQVVKDTLACTSKWLLSSFQLALSQVSWCCEWWMEGLAGSCAIAQGFVAQGFDPAGPPLVLYVQVPVL